MQSGFLVRVNDFIVGFVITIRLIMSGKMVTHTIIFYIIFINLMNLLSKFEFLMNSSVSVIVDCVRIESCKRR